MKNLQITFSILVLFFLGPMVLVSPSSAQGPVPEPDARLTLQSPEEVTEAGETAVQVPVRLEMGPLFCHASSEFDVVGVPDKLMMR